MFTQEQDQVFNEILENRRSCRKFTDQLPSPDDVSAVLKAGQLAPYASISARDVNPFRHFFVIYRDNPLLKQIAAILQAQAAVDVDVLRQEMAEDPFLQEYGSKLEKMWSTVAQNGPPMFPDQPCLIIMAEWRGARRAERQSLAHMAQNMWLKATSLNLDFGLISAIEGLADNEEFCSLLGLPTGRYGFLGCVLGYRSGEIPAAKPATTQIHWL